MKIEANEFSHNQALLIKLAQMLIPLSEKIALKVPSLSQHVFVPPPPSEEASIRVPVRAIKALNQIEKGVKQWMETIEKSPHFPSSKDGAQSTTTSAQNPRQSKEPSTSLGKNFDPNRVLIDQVRAAIQVLSSLPPTEGNRGFRDFLKKLKPTLDSLIELVGKGEMTATSDNETYASHKKPTPLPPLKLPQVKRQIPLPFGNKEEATAEKKEKTKEKPRVFVSAESPSWKTKKNDGRLEPQSLDRKSELEAAPSTRKGTKDESASPKKKEPLEPLPSRANSRPDIGKREEHSPSIPLHRPDPKLNPHLDLGRRGAASEPEQEGRAPQRVDRTSPPSLPFTPQLNPTAHPPKKKRKTFWFRDEEEEDEREGEHDPHS